MLERLRLAHGISRQPGPGGEKKHAEYVATQEPPYHGAPAGDSGPGSTPTCAPSTTGGHGRVTSGG
jgi:hypothetical protein